MREYKEVIETVKQLEFVICNKCGRKIDRTDDIIEAQEAIMLSGCGGYGSVFGDMTKWQLDLCQHCFKELFLPYIVFLDEEE